jgi:hypothetical protein
MVYENNTQNNWGLSIVLYFKNYGTQCFGKCMCPSSGEGKETPTLLGPLDLLKDVH